MVRLRRYEMMRDVEVPVVMMVVVIDVVQVEMKEAKIATSETKKK